jgi:hypothetical protein
MTTWHQFLFLNSIFIFYLFAQNSLAKKWNLTIFPWEFVLLLKYFIVPAIYHIAALAHVIMYMKNLFSRLQNLW